MLSRVEKKLIELLILALTILILVVAMGQNKAAPEETPMPKLEVITEGNLIVKWGYQYGGKQAVGRGRSVHDRYYHPDGS